MELTRADVVVPSRASLGIVMQGEVDIRIQCLDLHRSRSFAHPIHTPSRRIAFLEMLQKAATLLEFGVFQAAVAEASRERGHKTVAEFLADLDETMMIAGRIARLDFKDLVPRLRSVMPAEPAAVDPGEPLDSVVEDVVRAVGPMVVSCPIAEFEEAAAAIGRPDVGYRCRSAVDWLQAFLIRHSDPTRRRANIVGRGFADGRLTLRDAAELLGLRPSDAIVFLEERGFCRTADVIRLEARQRAATLEKLRERRLAGTTASSTNGDLVYREVVASQRIEGVDARSWLARR